MAKKRAKRLILFWLFSFLSIVIRILPLRFALFVGKFLGKISFYLLKKERDTALKNLDIAYGDSKSLEEKNALIRKVFENLGKNLIEIVSLPKFNASNIDKYISCRGIEVIEDFLNKGKGGIALSAHFGNWELMAHYFGIKGYSVNVVARRVRMEEFERFLVSIRKRNNVNVLYRDGSIKDILALLKKNQFIGIMPDQDMDSVSGVFVDFFGKKAFTPNGPAILHSLIKSPIIPCFMIRKGFGHEICIDRELRLASTDNKEKDILDNTAKYTKIIESYIRNNPEQWVWFHDRWKTRPD
ncbi:MAG: lysophospholipid acyltransferase family protein [Candidatus Omnitrophota bacterium]